MTAMDILEALGQTQEELLCGCDEVIGAGEAAETDVLQSDSGSTVNAKPQPERKKKRNSKRLFFAAKSKYRRAAAGFAAAAAVLLLVYVGGSVFIGRGFDTFSSGSSGSTSSSGNAGSTMESAEISADTAAEESAAEESEMVETEESAFSGTDSTEGTSSSAANPEKTETNTDAQTETAALQPLQLAGIYIPLLDTSSLSDEEYAGRMELAALVQEEIDAALSGETYETLPVYRFTMTGETSADLSGMSEGTATAQDDALSVSGTNLIEKLGDYPVITAQEAEDLLRQGYYLAPSGCSADDIDSTETVSVEIQYFISAETEIYMPYYQFTVVKDGDMVYVCCVPAVSSGYLEGTLSKGTVW